MTINKIWMWAVGALCVGVALAGCTQNGTSSTQQPNGTLVNNGNSDPSGPTQRGMNAPLLLNVRGPLPMPQNTPVTVDVEIQVNEPIAMPVTLQVQLPQGVQLLSGQPQEVLQLTQAGRLYRQYTVRTSGPLASPIVVTADARDPQGIVGLHAQREYPPAAPMTYQTANRPPMARPPAPPR